MPNKRRLELHEKLCEILGSRNVYFQPPESLKMVYPCIRYQRDKNDVLHADNVKYQKRGIYTITVIDKNPDSDIPDKIEDLLYCSSDRNYTADNLNHFVYKIYF